MDIENNLVGKFFGVYNQDGSLVGKRKITNVISLTNQAGVVVQTSLSTNTGMSISYMKAIELMENQTQFDSVPEFVET